MSVNVSYKDTLYSYGVSRSMLVKNLKEEISEKHSMNQFKLMLDQAELLDKKPVIKYLVTTFTLCYDDKEVAVEINDITLGVTVVNPEDQKVFTEKATPEMTVGQLKQIFFRKLISTGGKWTLKKDGQEIPDGDLLKTHLEVKIFTVNMQDIHVIIKYENRSHSITTKSDMTILEFKRLCSEKTGLPVEEVGLTFGGEELEKYKEVDTVIQSVLGGLQEEKLMEVEAIFESVRIDAEDGKFKHIDDCFEALVARDAVLAPVTKEFDKKTHFESRTLGSNRITDGSVIMITARVRGGSF